jgi:hypothetical protein
VRLLVRDVTDYLSERANFIGRPEDVVGLRNLVSGSQDVVALTFVWL